MLPVTVVKRFLNRQVPTVPLPPDIDEELTSNSGSWLVVSETRKPPCAASIACQTSPTSQLQMVKPRARPREDIVEESQALPPPKFRPKSRLPQLHYNGFQKPSLHCFTSSLSTPTIVDTPAQSRLLQASAKSLPSPAKFHRPIKSRQSTEEQESSEADRARHQLREIFVALDSLANCIARFTSQLLLINILIVVPTALGLEVSLCSYRFGNTQTAGAVVTTFPLPITGRKETSEPSRTRMTTHIKALRWLALKLDLPIISALQSQTVSDFLKSKTRTPFERSEATPIPMAVLAAWEKRAISDDSNPAEILTLGCFLIATMASLRFRDLLRTKPESLTIQGHILRGISWRTKTSVSGQPWGVCCPGITTRPSNKHWIFRFLEVVESGTQMSQQHWGKDWKPDFLLPSWTDSAPFTSPCSYRHGLALIRYYAQCNWLQPPLLSPDQAKELSTHSMKSTFLAAAGQLNINTEQRAKQGHRKSSVQLYSRDDVWPSLFLQKGILIDIKYRVETTHISSKRCKTTSTRTMFYITSYYRC